LEHSSHYWYERSMSRRTAIAAISPVASEQWGMVTAGQARRLGVSRQDLNRLLDDGTPAIADQAMRVYRLTGAPKTLTSTRYVRPGCSSAEPSRGTDAPQPYQPP
jgi:hypothetical protein